MDIPQRPHCYPSGFGLPSLSALTDIHQQPSP